MHHDIHGLPISTASRKAAAAFDRTLMGYLKYRADVAGAACRAARGRSAISGWRIASRAISPCCPTSRRTCRWRSRPRRRARRLAANATPREQAHVAALDAWIAGDLDRALGVWEEILGEHPHDVLAFRLAHFNNFWLGRPGEMRASVERVKPKWSRDLPGYGTVLSCHCFSQEECGDYAVAEPSGRAAIEIDPGDVWGTHAVAHIMEMQGRHAEGIAWLDELERHWEGGNNLLHHLWWHRALFHLERREFDAVLDLYDRRFRNLGSPLTQAQPDLYIDVQNAASMLFRLERLGIDVGDRWSEIADKAETRIGDCLSAFTLAALDDGARRQPAATMRRGACSTGCARSAAGEGTVRAHRARASRCRSARPCWRIGSGDHARALDADAAGARRHASARRQPCAAGRADAALPRQRREGRLRRRRASHT